MEHKEVSNKSRPKTAAQREGWVRKIRRQQQEKITRLQRRITELTTENIRLKKIVAMDARKAEHGCTDVNCPLCKEEEGDGTWEFLS